VVMESNTIVSVSGQEVWGSSRGCERALVNIEKKEKKSRQEEEGRIC
jgi:hypothetical protein